MIYLLCFLAIYFMLPVLLVICTSAPVNHKVKASLCMLEAGLKGLVMIPVDLSAMVVMPVVLLFIKKDAQHLPKWLHWYDNDVSINGDEWAVFRDGEWRDLHQDPTTGPLRDGEVAVAYTDPAYTGDAYYCKGSHPTSYKARVVWLAFRNRASRLAEILGYTYGDVEDRESWGDDKTGRDHEGLVLNRCDNKYQLYFVKKLGKLCYRVNYGYKLWKDNTWGKPTAPVVAIFFSILSWKGK